MIKISACVIAKDEAENIARCLQSVKDAADEIIVVDTGSSDDTAEIAAARGRRFLISGGRTIFRRPATMPWRRPRETGSSFWTPTSI